MSYPSTLLDALTFGSLISATGKERHKYVCEYMYGNTRQRERV